MNKDKILAEISNSREMIKMLLDQMAKLEERVCSGAVSLEDAIQYAKSWEEAIQNHYLEVDILTKRLFD